jgi:hypothetical protein
MVFLILTVSFAGCTRYQTKYTAFRPPEGYGNFQIVDGVKVGGEAYVDNDAAEDAFGFDVKGAGLLPVQLVLDNRSGKNTEIVADQTFLVDKNNGYWRIIPTNVAISRLENSTQLAAYFGKGAGKGAILGAAAGTALGAALGIVSGRNVGGGALRGGALGTAGGAVIGGTSEGSSQERGRRITDDLRAKSLEGKVIPADHLANGFIFFPGEAESAKELRLRLRQPESEAERTVVLGFPQKLGK